MELSEFMQVATLLGVKFSNGNRNIKNGEIQGNIQFLETIATKPLATGRNPHVIYSFEYRGVTFRYDTTKYYVSITGENFKCDNDIKNEAYGISQDKVFRGQDKEGNNIYTQEYRVKTRAGFIQSLLTFERPENLDENDRNRELLVASDEFRTINAVITRQNLDIAKPQLPPTKTLEVDLARLELRRALTDFDNSVNPYLGKNLDGFDYTQYPPTIHIMGRYNEEAGPKRILEITDLITRKTVRYSYGDFGTSHSLRYDCYGEVRVVTHLYQKREKGKLERELIKIKAGDNSEVVYDVNYKEVLKATGIFASLAPERVEAAICEYLQVGTVKACEITNQCVQTPTTRTR